MTANFYILAAMMFGSIGAAVKHSPGFLIVAFFAALALTYSEGNL